MKKYISSEWLMFVPILFLIIGFISCGSEQEITWIYTYDNGLISGAIAENTSDYIVVGTTRGDTTSYFSAWMCKINEMGDLQWEKTIEPDAMNAMAMLTGGGLVIADDHTNDIRVIKTDTAGVVEWEMTYGGPRNDEVESMCQTGDGGFVLLGTTQLAFPTQENNEDIMLIRADAFGHEYWKRTYDFEEINDRGFDVQQTSDGGFIFTGYSHDEPLYKGLLVKTNEHGYIIWVKYFDDIFTRYVCEGEVNSCIVVFDTLLCKFDESGDLVWQVSFVLPNGTIRSMCCTDDNGCIITGGSTFGDTDIWLMKYDSNGNEEWTHTYRDDEAAHSFDIITTSDGGYIILGSTHNQNYDMVLIKTNAVGEVIPPTENQ